MTITMIEDNIETKVGLTGDLGENETKVGTKTDADNKCLLTPDERNRSRRCMALDPVDQFLATIVRLKRALVEEIQTDR
uniref:Uncharacterized protein n=1 Tax=Magallana gigas TaxID=29159 RepID=A0A8W8I4S9_MAGGI